MLLFWLAYKLKYGCPFYIHKDILCCFYSSDDASGRNDDDTTSEQKQASVDLEASSAERGRRSERGSDRDRERDLERDKERELERYERERERERARRDRDRENRLREAERVYEEREREWENRERDRERLRLHDKEREKERERDRRREIKEQEEESDEDERRKHRYRGSLQDEKRKRRHREREEDVADCIREQEEAALAELAKRHKPSPDNAAMANNETAINVEESAHTRVEEPAAVLQSMSMFDSDSDEEPPQSKSTGFTSNIWILRVILDLLAYKLAIDRLLSTFLHCITYIDVEQLIRV